VWKREKGREDITLQEASRFPRPEIPRQQSVMEEGEQVNLETNPSNFFENKGQL
jgi:hypothetical protein